MASSTGVRSGGATGVSEALDTRRGGATSSAAATPPTCIEQVSPIAIRSSAIRCASRSGVGGPAGPAAVGTAAVAALGGADGAVDVGSTISATVRRGGPPGSLTSRAAGNGGTDG